MRRVEQTDDDDVSGIDCFNDAKPKDGKTDGTDRIHKNVVQSIQLNPAYDNLL